MSQEFQVKPSSDTVENEQPIRQVMRDGVEYTIIGTAHVSRTSAEAVRKLASTGDFQAIAVELCQSRYESLTAGRKWTDLDLYKVIREGKAGLVMSNLALSAYQRRLADQLGIEPGAEMRAAIVAAKECDLSLQLVDRNIATTLWRSYANVPWYRRFYLVAGLVMGVVSFEDIDEESIEKLKDGDILESIFTEFAEQSPELFETLITERDRYMAARLRQENTGGSGRKVLVVIGAGHLAGLSSQLKNSAEPPDNECERLDEMPRRAIWPRLVPWTMMVLVLAGFYVGFSRSPELGWQLVFIWVAINGGLAGLGALIVRGHPLTVLSAVVAAPITSLNPAIGAGMVTGLVESWIRKPRVSDLENLRSDITTLRGWFKNPATRILLVFLSSNLGSTIGTWVAGFKIFNTLS